MKQSYQGLQKPKKLAKLLPRLPKNPKLTKSYQGHQALQSEEDQVHRQSWLCSDFQNKCHRDYPNSIFDVFVQKQIKT